MEELHLQQMHIPLTVTQALTTTAQLMVFLRKKKINKQVIVKILISFNGGSLILYTTYATLTLHTENMSGVQH